MTTQAPHWTHQFFAGMYRDVYAGPLFNKESTALEVSYLAAQFADAKESGTLLDIGCGFGRHTAGLRKQGFDVVGIDRFHHLLQHHPARSRRVACADMRALPFADGVFAGAYCLFNTFGYFDHAQNIAMLPEWARVLAPGASLVMQIPNRPVMADIAREFAPTQMMNEDFTVTESYSYDVALRSLVGRGIWQQGADQQEWQFTLRMYTRAEMQKALSKAGLSVVTVAEDYDGSEFSDRTSVEMILVARRK